MYDYLSKMSAVMRSNVNINDFADSFNTTQLNSKRWVVEEVCKYVPVNNPKILILGGWYGSYLVPMLREHLDPSHIYFNDLNPSCLEIAKKLHGNSAITYHNFDAREPYTHFDADLVINTSCEHMSSYEEMLREGSQAVFVCQSCDNANDPGHVNVSRSTQEFVAKLGFRQVLFAGRKDLGHKNRFLVVGKT